MNERNLKHQMILQIDDGLSGNGPISRETPGHMALASSQPLRVVYNEISSFLSNQGIRSVVLSSALHVKYLCALW